MSTNNNNAADGWNEAVDYDYAEAYQRRVDQQKSTMVATTSYEDYVLFITQHLISFNMTMSEWPPSTGLNLHNEHAVSSDTNEARSSIGEFKPLNQHLI